MKKFLITSLLVILANFSAFAQNPSPVSSSDSKTSDAKMEKNPMKEERAKKWQARYDNASPQQKEKMDARRKIMESLSGEQKTALKAEKEKHRKEMLRITGFDIESLSDEQKDSAMQERQRHRAEIKKITGQDIE